MKEILQVSKAIASRQTGRAKAARSSKSNGGCRGRIGDLRNNAPMNSRRNIAQSSKIRAMTGQQIKQLRRWLLVEKLTYQQASLHLRERFGLDFSTANLCHFWQQYCCRISPPAQGRQPIVFLDVVIQSIKPVRVKVLETKSRLRFKVGTQRQLALLKKPSFTINPPGADKSQP